MEISVGYLSAAGGLAAFSVGTDGGSPGNYGVLNSD